MNSPQKLSLLAFSVGLIRVAQGYWKRSAALMLLVLGVYIYEEWKK